jgi:two-component system, NarL family, response regulator LiaR
MAQLRIQVLTSHRLLVDVLEWRLNGEPDLVLDPPLPLRRVVVGRADPPDVVILDCPSLVTRRQRTFDDLLATARSDTVRWRLVVLSNETSAPLAIKAVRAGASAWLPSSCGADEVVRVLRGVGRGEAFFTPRLLGPVLDGLRAELDVAPEATSPIDTLTGREREVLACLVAGWNSRAIASRLDMAENTVRTHTTRIIRKLGVHSQVEAVRLVHEAGHTSETLAKPAPSSASTSPADPTGVDIPRPRTEPYSRIVHHLVPRGNDSSDSTD